MTLKVNHEAWEQTPDDLRRLALQAPHPRTRERFMALYQVTQGASATSLAPESRRWHQTLMRWIHWYNERGPDGLTFTRTGGRPPFAQKSKTRSAR
jgi:transposase